MAQAMPALTKPTGAGTKAEGPVQAGKVLPMEAVRKEKATEKDADVAIEVLGLFFM